MRNQRMLQQVPSTDTPQRISGLAFFDRAASSPLQPAPLHSNELDSIAFLACACEHLRLALLGQNFKRLA